MLDLGDVTDGRIEPVDRDTAGPVALARAFLKNPGRFLKHLIGTDLIDGDG